MSILFITLIILLLIILPIYFYNRKTHGKRKRKEENFRSFLKDKDFAVDYLMQRSDQMAALDTKCRRIAWQNLSQIPLQEPTILFLSKEAKHSITTSRADRTIQKIALRPIIAQGGDAPEIVFYDWVRDNYPLISKYTEEAKQWEVALNSIEFH